MAKPSDPLDELTQGQKHYAELCGPPPLVDGEDAARYHRLLVGVVKATKPNDVPDWLWIRDIVDQQWEILRYRSAKAHLISSAETEARRYLSLDTALSGISTDQSEISAAAIIAHAVAAKLTDLRRFDLMLMSMEYRRDSTYREIENRRTKRGKPQREIARRGAFAPALIEDHSHD
jgi:hypothetical protein